MIRSGRIMAMAALLPLSAALALVAGSAPALADALVEKNARIVEDPANIALNLDYALVAEGQGKYRLALAAYERILLNHPDNVDAKRGLMRVRRIIQPPSTQVFVEAGSRWESNALRTPDDERDDFVGFMRGRVKDERTFNGTRWRTVGTLYGELHAEEERLNYVHSSATLGPIFDLGSAMASLHPAIGGGVAMADGDFYYADVNVSALVEGYLEGAYQWARLRAGYRQYDESLTADEGFYLDAAGRIARADVFVEGDTVSLSPWIRWSEIDGTFDDFINEFSPGRYVAGGARLAYDRVLNERVTAGVSLAVRGRHFLVDEAPGGDDREDWTIIPGATVLFKDVFGKQTGLRFDYEFQYNDSNDPSHDYRNHVIGVSAIVRR